MMMIWKFIKLSSVGLGIAATLAGCMQSDYTKLVKDELAKGIRQDSLLLGIRFGDTQQDFFGKCFDLNKQQLVTQGPRGLSVQYEFKDSTVHREPTELILYFSPTFDTANVISEMKLEFSYKAWAPWNRPLQSDSLEHKVQALLMSWYKGNDFITADVGREPLLVKLDGNRRLLLKKKDVQYVEVFVQDILHPMFMHSISADKKAVATAN